MAERKRSHQVKPECAGVVNSPCCANFALSVTSSCARALSLCYWVRPLPAIPPAIPEVPRSHTRRQVTTRSCETSMHRRPPSSTMMVAVLVAACAAHDLPGPQTSTPATGANMASVMHTRALQTAQRRRLQRVTARLHTAMRPEEADDLPVVATFDRRDAPSNVATFYSPVMATFDRRASNVATFWRGHHLAVMIAEMHDAAMAGDIVALERSLAKGSVADAAFVNVVGEEGYTALHHAAFCGKAAAVSILLQHGASIEARTRVLGLSPLMLACHGQLATHEDVVRVLLEAGAEPDAVDWMVGSSSLMFAAFSGDEGLVRLLFAAGARLDLRDHFSKNATTCKRLDGLNPKLSTDLSRATHGVRASPCADALQQGHRAVAASLECQHAYDLTMWTRRSTYCEFVLTTVPLARGPAQRRTANRTLASPSAAVLPRDSRSFAAVVRAGAVVCACERIATLLAQLLALVALGWAVWRALLRRAQRAGNRGDGKAARKARRGARRRRNEDAEPSSCLTTLHIHRCLVATMNAVRVAACLPFRRDWRGRPHALGRTAAGAHPPRFASAASAPQQAKHQQALPMPSASPQELPMPSVSPQEPASQSRAPTCGRSRLSVRQPSPARACAECAVPVEARAQPVKAAAASVEAVAVRKVEERASTLPRAPGGPAAAVEDECVVCLERGRDHVLLPCGHLCVCEACALQVQGGPTPVCPLCRQGVQSAVRVFY